MNTRWNSTYAMIGSVIEQQAAIVAIFHTRRELHYLEPSPTEWRILEDLHCLLEPLRIPQKYSVVITILHSLVLDPF